MTDSARPKTTKDFAQLGDREIVAACLERDSAAWEALIFRYQRLIYSIPIKMGFSTVDAADVFQSVCLALLEKLPTLRNHEKISSWLMTTTTRECWRVAAQWRRESPAERRDPDDQFDKLDQVPSQEPLADEEREMLEQQQIVREAVTALPERCRKLISLLFYNKDDLSYTDVARRMKMPVASVGPTRARCLEKLKKLLDGKI
ncbi:MAG: sigma-70 family RNA polymerase sigma factor [Blastocatellia bacterium]|nr:sigma-70 family RNA polymerase sigma factor [Blastocatellia bacterium]